MRGSKKFQNMNVKDRLVKSFIFITLLASVSGVVAAFMMFFMDMRYGRALEMNGFIQGDIGEYLAYLETDGALVREIILESDITKIEEVQNKLSENDKQIDYYLQQFEGKLETEEEEALLEQINTNFAGYINKRNNVIERASINHDSEALRIFREEANPYIYPVIEAANELLSINRELGDSTSAWLSMYSKLLILGILIFMAVIILISIKLGKNTAKDFVEPIEKVQKATQKLKKGELDVNIVVESKNELGEMADNLNQAIAKIREYIGVLEYGLEAVGNGDFTVKPTVEFLGDFIKIKEAIENITISLSHTLGQINEGADQVAIGSEQMAESAQVLAEGATSQAASVEELTATVESVTAVAKDCAEKAGESHQMAESYAVIAGKSSAEMKKLTEAMGRITDTSHQIESIIAEIEDIAEQTNLLSLNASIEAARAGEAGRGFAVVADQIGKLAADSAQSAVNTRELIAKTLNEIEQGNTITMDTAEILAEVVDGMKKLAKAAEENSVISGQQADTMAQIEIGIEQIADVVQNNSASAEETSATSEELSAQSQNLKALVDHFILIEDLV